MKEAVRRAQEEKIEQRKAEEGATGCKKRGRQPKTPEQAVEEKAEANANDPASGNSGDGFAVGNINGGTINGNTASGNTFDGFLVGDVPLLNSAVFSNNS